MSEDEKEHNQNIEFAVMFWIESFNGKCPSCKKEIKYHDWYIEEWIEKDGENTDDYCVSCGLKRIKKVTTNENFEQRSHILSERINKEEQSVDKAFKSILTKNIDNIGITKELLDKLPIEEQHTIILLSLIISKSDPERIILLFEFAKSLKLDIDTMGNELEDALSQLKINE